MRKRGQSIVEYTIVFAAVIAAIIYGATKLIKPAVKKGMEDSKTIIEESTGKLTSMIGKKSF